MAPVWLWVLNTGPSDMERYEGKLTRTPKFWRFLHLLQPRCLLEGGVEGVLLESLELQFLSLGPRPV